MRHLESISQYVFLLTIYNLIFFYGVYKNNFLLSTSELVEDHFFFWAKMGRFRNIIRDKIFYYFPICFPHLSIFYPWRFLSAIIARKLSIDFAFRLFIGGELLHYFLGSVISLVMFSQWYSLPVSLLGAITLAYMAYNIKVYSPYLGYTAAWIPGMFIQGWFGIFSVGMAILGGGYPIFVYIFPLAVLNNPNCLWGVLIGLPQIIPFLWYFPKSIKSNFNFDQSFGRMKVWCLLDMIYPIVRGTINRVAFPEMVTYFGIIPLLFIPFSTSRIWIFTPIFLLGMFGVFRVPFRVPSRFIYSFCFCLIWMSCNGLENLGLSYESVMVIVLLQGFMVLKNADLVRIFPYSQWAMKPSEFVKKYVPKSFRFPFRTGYYFDEETRGYTGGQALKKIVNKYGITDPNGEPTYY